MPSRLLVAGVVLLPLVAAGCLLPDEVASGHDVADCQQIALFVPITLHRAQNLLPPGYEPVEASSFQDDPRWSGHGLGYVDFLACASSEAEGGPYTASTVAVLIETPEAPSLSIGDADHDFYTLAYWTDGLNQQERLERTGYAAGHAVTSVDAAGPGFDGRSDGPRAAAHYVEGRQAFNQTRGETTWHYWHEAYEGVTVFEATTPEREYAVGVVGACEALGPSPAQDLLSGGECDRLSARLVAWQDVGWEGRVVHYPAEHVTAGR